MVAAPALDGVIDSCRDLIETGIALHWLHPYRKAPIGEDWSTKPRHTLDSLRKSYVRDANIGVRPGRYSSTASGFLHLIDLDIRDPAQAAGAWSVLREMLPGVDDMPTVISGSGGESRHVYFFVEKPFDSRKLAKSEGFSMVFDPEKGREVRKNHWEIELFGTGKQAVIPPSIHPDTREPYRWIKPLDCDFVSLGLVKTVPAEIVESWGVSSSDDEDESDDDDGLLSAVRAAPMGLSEDEIARTVADLPLDWVDDRDTWVQVGAALHHEYEGSQKGFDRWCEWSRSSAKFDMKTQKTVWKSFKGARNPVRMATLIQAAGRTRLAREHDWMDDLLGDAPVNLPATTVSDPLVDLLGEPVSPATAPKKTDPEWRSLLQLTEEGEVKSTLPNIALIVANDQRTFGIAALNEFTQRVVLIKSPGRFSLKRASPKPVKQLDSPIWKVADPVNGDAWIDDHDHSLREVLESPRRQGGYDLRVSDRDLKAAIVNVSNHNRFHPIRDYLLERSWDGVPRVDRMFIDYLGCPDTPYHRAASRMTLLGAVARVFEPGHKFDFVPILEGLQGKGKSTFINILGHAWSSELVGDFGDANKMVESMQGKWILEIPELQGFSKAEVTEIKAFVSRTSDQVRLAWEKRARDYKRQCIFIGSTNDSEYLRDQTGGRRFWPIKCDVEGQIDNKRFAGEIDQIWAEAYAMYAEMRRTNKESDLPLYLEDEAAGAEAKLIQESKRMETPEEILAGKIQVWLDQPIGTATGFDDLDGDAPQEYRNETCIAEIWSDFMGRDGIIPHRETIMLGRAMTMLTDWRRTPSVVSTKKWGRIRAYRRNDYNGG